MGTHAYIRFVHGDLKSPWVYVHYDGYLGGIADRLKVFFEITDDRYGTIHGLDYVVASFVVISKVADMVYTPKSLPRERLRLETILENLYLYYGVSSEKENIYNYEYIIDLKDKIILVRDYNNKEIFFGPLDLFIEKFCDEKYVKDVLERIRRLAQLIKTHL